jgi:phosphotransferase system  glucose/maltose/N-acetylglucosamine-specific IIC component
MRRYNQFAEWLWFTSGIVFLGLSIYIIYQEGWERGNLYLLTPVIAFLMFFTRRFMRKKLESRQQKETEKQKEKKSEKKNSKSASE